MTTQDSSSSTLGPRYAPNDPTLPEPWKGLIDGSTCVLYYWNPETNVTQYERPTSLPSCLQTEPPPAGNTPRLIHLPEARASQIEITQTPHYQHMVQNQLPQGQLTAAASQPQIQAGQWDSQQLAPTRQLQGQHLGTNIPLGHLAPEQLRAQMVQHSSVQMQSQVVQSPLQQGQPVLQQFMQQTQQAPYQPVHSMPYAQPAPVYQGAQIGAPLGYQFMPQSTPHMAYQHTISSQKPQSSSQHLTQGQQLPPKQESKLVLGQRDNMEFHQGGSDLSPVSPAHQHPLQGKQFSQARDIKAGISLRNDVEVQQVKKAGRSPSHIQQAGKPSLLNSSMVTTHSHHAQELSFPPNQCLQRGGASVIMQQNSPSVHAHKGGAELTSREYVPGFQNQMGPGMMQGQPQNIVQAQQGGTELIHQEHGSSSHNRMGPGLLHGQPHNILHGGPKMPYEENHVGRPENDFLHTTSRDANRIPPQLPKLAPLPIARNQPEMRLDDHAGLPFQGVYHQSSSAPPYPNNAFMRPPLPTMGPSDPMHLSVAEVYCQKHEVTVTGENVPAPFMTFEAAGFPPELLQEAAKWTLGAFVEHYFLKGASSNSNYVFDREFQLIGPESSLLFAPFFLPQVASLHLAGFASPTPIQAQTWPIALQNRDIVAIAKTGSGKTLGYLIPAFMHLRTRHNNAQNGPTVLVLAPTRELATQIQDEASKFGRSSRFSCTCLYGGAPKGPQLRELERGADIVVATPGRLNDILEMKRIDFRQVSLLVLDEADRMLDMGFEPQIRKIVNMIPPRRQTLMYTATWPKDVRKIAGDLLINPVQVNIGSVDELAANKSITQYVEMVPEMEKQRRLEQILRSQEHGSKVIIFCSTKKLCDHLARSLGRYFGAAAIHGDKSQGERDWVLNQFRSGKSQVLVATDVAARGLDIRDIRVVINYDFPTGIEDYVHRIGRTGRAGASGVSYTFFSDQDWKYAPDLVKVLEGANQVVPPEIRDIALRGGPSFGRDRRVNSRYNSADGGGRGDSGDRVGMRDGSFGGRGGIRDGNFFGRGGIRDDNFGGHGGIRDGNFGGRGEMRDGSLGGRGGMKDGGFSGRGGMRDGGFSGRGGMRDGNFGGHGGGRDGNFFNPSGGRVGWDRGGCGTNDRFGNLDVRGCGRGRGRGRFDNRRDSSDRSRGRSFSPSPERVRTWDYSRSSSRSSSRSRSRRRSRSYSRSRRSSSRSWSHSRNPKSSPSRSRSRSYERYARRPPRQSKFDQMEVPAPHVEIPLEPRTSVNSPAARGNGLSEAELSEHTPRVGNVDLDHPVTGAGPNDPPSNPR